jgi:hypothetical protein
MYRQERSRIGLGTLLVLLSLGGPGGAQEGIARRPEPLAELVKQAIDKGVRYLRQSQRDNGSWEVEPLPPRMRGGCSCLALLALLNCGVPPDDPCVARGLEWLRLQDPEATYVRALQTMVFAEAGRPEDRERLRQNVDWLLRARLLRNGQFQGWTYDDRTLLAVGDNSNTQYALLGLHAAKSAGIPIPRRVWEEIRDYYLRTQLADGGWAYTPIGPLAGGGSTLTMTTAGICGLLIAGAELNQGRETLREDGRAEHCGLYLDNAALARGLAWLSTPLPNAPGLDRFSLVLGRRTFYNLYGIERAGRLSGLRFFGNHDWYREGCRLLVVGDRLQDPTGAYRQHANGSWSAPGFYDQWPVISTSFALLFLSKGRTPVLISKLVHGPWPRQVSDLDWNNDRNDLAHLTRFVQQELFPKLPLAWQTVDVQRALSAPARDRHEPEDQQVLSDLLQSPIVYLTGHRSPLGRLTVREQELLKRYVENGGLLLVEACCGSRQFDAGFRELVRKLWPDQELAPLPADHPVWRAHFPVPPGSFGLEGLHLGCKTVLFYAPRDLSCLWEANRFDKGLGQLAFRLGANIVAYATGLEPPQPRLTETELPNLKDNLSGPSRGYFQAAQLKYAGDWQPAPNAMRHLLSHLHRTAGLDVLLRTEALTLDHPDLVNFKFLYLHGKGKFHFPPERLKALRFNLQTGGLLLADACCGSPAFDAAFRDFARQLFPDRPLERVPADDLLFSKELNGEALGEHNIRCRRERNGPLRPMAPWLEGIRLDGRWVVLYSKYDLGCALERHQSSDCLGYDHASALRLGSAAVLYLLRP